MSKELSREELLRLGWVNIKTIKKIAPTFTNQIPFHLESGYVQHAVNNQGYNLTNWYRLTHKGREHFRASGYNAVARAFKIVPQAELETSRNALWNRGWMPAYPWINNRYISAAERLKLIKRKEFLRRLKKQSYIRLTKDGEKFYQEFIKLQSRLNLCRALKRVSAAESRERLKREFAARLEDDLGNNISHFLYDCRDNNSLQRALHSLARTTKTKI